MNIILIRKQKGTSGYVNLSRRRLIALSLITFLIFPLSLMYVGYWFGTQGIGQQENSLYSALKNDFQKHKTKLDTITYEAEQSMNALAIQLGQLRAHVIRLDALGERVTETAGLDGGEFNFSQSPAQGGPRTTGDMQRLQIPDFLTSLHEFTDQLDNRSRQLAVLESMLMNRNLQTQVLPAGRPIKKGWASSFFGMRTDPFSGRREHHYGIDFAGKEGSDVVAVASGVVTWAGARYGYGNLVEINHGNGYSTRYGHSNKVTVNVGDTVKKGKVIALMGSTGRSTGPHVHFEVLLNGRAVNPAKFVEARR